jgi:hypothetical protein
LSTKTTQIDCILFCHAAKIFGICGNALAKMDASVELARRKGIHDVSFIEFISTEKYSATCFSIGIWNGQFTLRALGPFGTTVTESGGRGFLGAGAHGSYWGENTPPRKQKQISTGFCVYFSDFPSTAFSVQIKLSFPKHWMRKR